MMEKRKVERVQFFQMSTGRDIQPVWVFRQNYPEAVLGLLLDITSAGAQVLTNKLQELDEMDYKLVIHLGEDFAEESLAVNVRRRWSRPEGTLYVRHGFAFEEQVAVQPMLSALHAGVNWLRCELVPR